MIQNYDEFITELHRAGFSLGGGSSKGIYAAVPFDWTEQPAGTQVRWHTGEPDTDPWEWRMRVLEERSDIASATLPGYAANFTSGSYYVLDAGGVADIVNRYLNPYEKEVQAAELYIRNG